MSTSTSVDDAAKPSHARGLALLVVVLIASLYVLRHLDRGWVPFDDGALAQAAERAMRGELPHRDFDDIYTGGLALWDGLVFRAWGVNLMALRDALFMVFVLWLPAVYYLASRVATPVRAAFVTFLCVVWSLPNYNAAMPSWYNLFLATFAIAAIARYIETNARRWLLAAGIAVGLSILVKIVGLYLVAAALLVFVNEEQIVSQCAEPHVAPRATHRGFSWFVTACLGLFVAALALLVSRRAFPAELIQFFAPGALLATFLIRREWSFVGAPARTRLARLAGMIAPFLLGLAIPLAVFLVPYVRSGAVPALVTGVFIVPTRRFAVATMRLPPVWTMLGALAPIALVWIAWRLRRRVRWYESLLAALVVIALVRASGTNELLYRWVWFSARALFPLLVIAGLYALGARRVPRDASPRLQRLTWLLLASASMASLVQYPFSAPSYFTYVAPLVILTGLALLAWLGPLSPVPLRALFAVYLLFGMFRMNISLLTRMGMSHVPYSGTKLLTMERGGLRVSRTEADIYNAIVPALRAHARGSYTWAAPDLPEIYFLSGLRNPTRALFDFLGDEESRADRLIDRLDAHGITAVVINLNPYYSPALAPDVVQALERRFPNAQDFGPYQLRWRT